MPWTDSDQARAETAIRHALGRRARAGFEVDVDPRVVAAMAPENTGNNRHPQGPTLEGNRLSRRLTSGRFDRWATVVWRASLAAQVARSKARRAAFAAGAVPTPNRASRRAAAKLRRQADR